MIVWFDLETTGLDFADDVVLEVAAIATDESLALESEPFHALIRPTPEGLGRLALNPIVALELVASGVWAGTGVLGPEAFDAVPFLDLLATPKPEGYGSPWGMEER